MGPIVFKLGGSLLDWPDLPDRLTRHLAGRATREVVLVVGGGPAADVVRDWDRTHGLGESRSHRLALRALELTASLAAELLPRARLVTALDELALAWSSDEWPILAPREFLETVDAGSPQPLPQSWAVTTDSIAARLAERLGAGELQLLKSVDLGGLSTLREAALAGLVDPCFPQAARTLPIVTFVNLRSDPPATSRLY